MKTFLLKNPKRILAVAGLASIYGLFGTASAQTHKVREYANYTQTTSNQSLLGVTLSSVTNAANAISGSPRDSSHLQVTVGALSLIQAIQYLEFTTDGTHANKETITAGTPIYVKFSSSAALVAALKNMEIGTFTNLNKPALGDWTATRTVAFTDASLLSLINGAGTNEIKITPAADCNGVYIRLSPTLSVASSTNLFHAYVLKDESGDAGCPSPMDWLSGIEDVAGISLANATASVTNPSSAIDNDLTTATTVSTGAQVASAAYYTALLNTPAKAGDSVQVIMNNPDGGLINLALLSGFTIQAYNGETAVGDPVSGSSSLLKLQLLPGSTAKNVIKAPIVGTNAGDFDRVKITFGGVADVSSILGNGTTDIYDLRVKVAAPTLGGDGKSDIYAYKGSTVDLGDLATANAAGDPIVWIDSTTGAEVSATSFEATASNRYFGLSERDGCTDASDTAKIFLHVNKTTSPALTAGNVNTAYSQIVTADIDGDQDLPNTPVYSFTYESSSFTPAAGGALINSLPGTSSSFAFYAMAPVYASGPLSAVASQAFASTDLSHGLSFDDATGTVSGTPDAEGTYSLVLNVHDDANGLDAGQITKSIEIAAALPVTLTDFNVHLDNDKNAVLTWKTESEQGSIRFDVLRSNDGTNFSTIGSVDAAGVSTKTLNYSFTDNNPGAKSYYKLSIVNNDGIKTSDVRSITGGRVAGFSINPNPATNDITITGINVNDIKSVNIYDAGGRLVQKATNNHINVRNLSQGIYFVTIVTKDGNKTNGKFLKK